MDPTTNNGGAVDVENNALVLQDGFYIAFNQVGGKSTIEPVWLDSMWYTQYNYTVGAYGIIRLSTSGMYICFLSID